MQHAPPIDSEKIRPISWGYGSSWVCVKLHQPSHAITNQLKVVILHLPHRRHWMRGSTPAVRAPPGPRPGSGRTRGAKPLRKALSRSASRFTSLGPSLGPIYISIPGSRAAAAGASPYRAHRLPTPHSLPARIAQPPSHTHTTACRPVIHVRSHCSLARLSTPPTRVLSFLPPQRPTAIHRRWSKQARLASINQSTITHRGCLPALPRTRAARASTVDSAGGWVGRPRPARVPATCACLIENGTGSV